MTVNDDTMIDDEIYIGSFMISAPRPIVWFFIAFRSVWLPCPIRTRNFSMVNQPVWNRVLGIWFRILNEKNLFMIKYVDGVTLQAFLPLSPKKVANHCHLRLDRLSIWLYTQIYGLRVSVRVFSLWAFHQARTWLSGTPHGTRRAAWLIWFSEFVRLSSVVRQEGFYHSAIYQQWKHS